MPQALRKAVDGRKLVSLGVPPSATVGDAVETLLSLYPQLKRHITDDKHPQGPGLQLFLGDRAGLDYAQVLSEGTRLYLFALAPKRLSDARV